MSSTRARSTLDHLLLGCADLERGMDFVEQHLGVRPIFGGVHPGRGTCNALLSLGERRYLEVIAPDPDQAVIQPWVTSRVPAIVAMTTPQLVGWAVRCDDIDLLTLELRQEGIDVHAVHERSRTRADGSVLCWKMATLVDDRDGLLPFFIEWNRDSRHPSDDGPQGCRLERFTINTPQYREFSHLFRLLEVDAGLQNGDRPSVEVIVTGTQGSLRIGPDDTSLA